MHPECAPFEAFDYTPGKPDRVKKVLRFMKDEEEKLMKEAEKEAEKLMEQNKKVELTEGGKIYHGTIKNQVPQLGLTNAMKKRKEHVEELQKAQET